MSAAPQPQPKRVLIIDDDPAVVELLRSALERKHIESAGSTSGAAALAMLTSNQFEVILLDLGLPDIHGLELIRQLRELAPGARIIIVTADATSETLLRAIREQAFEYVRKPFLPPFRSEAFKSAQKPFDIHEVVDVVLRASSAVGEPAIEVHSAKPEW